jgi:hypothetical protein
LIRANRLSISSRSSRSSFTVRLLMELIFFFLERTKNSPKSSPQASSSTTSKHPLKILSSISRN